MKTCERLGAKKTTGAKRGGGLGRAFPVFRLTFGLLDLFQSYRVYGGRRGGGGLVKNEPRSLGGVVELTIGNTRKHFIPRVLRLYIPTCSPV